MLNLFDTEKVPGVPSVQVYRDDEKSNRFYIVTESVQIARDPTGAPLATFILHARDVDKIEPDTEVERGYLALSVQVVVTKEEEKFIRDHLRAKLELERNAGSWFLRLNGLSGGPVEPEISYPSEFVDGTVKFDLLTPDLVPVSAGSGKPSLINTNLASFSSQLNQDGAELLHAVLQGGDVPAIVSYELAFLARIPAITIRIHGDKSEFFREIVTHYFQSHSRTQTIDYGGFWSYQYREYYSTSVTTMEQFRSTFHSVTIDIDDRDFRNDPEAEDLTKKMEEMALTIFKDNVMPAMFAPLAAVPPEQRKNFDSVVQQLQGTVDIVLQRSDVVQKKIAPNGQLRAMLTPDEVKKVIRYVDLGQPMFQELEVNVHANVNFEHDPIFGLKVFIEYDQLDDVRNVRVRKAREFLIDTADTVKQFQVLMAKGADGATKDTYRQWSKLIYEETGEEIRVPVTGVIETNERELVISYRRLGFVKVNISLGTMPDSLESVSVHMRCPASTAPSADQTFELTATQPAASFFTYTGQPGGAEYLYTLRYILTDGQRLDVPEQASTSELLVVRNPFDSVMTTRFVGQGDFSVINRVIVEAVYDDPQNGVHDVHRAELAVNGESSDWIVGLRDTSRLGFNYVVTVLFADGSRSEPQGKNGKLGETVLVGIESVATLEVKLIPNFAGDDYRMALVELEYKDAANSIDRRQSFRLRADDDEAVFKVQLLDRNKRGYRHRVQLVGLPPTPNQDQGWLDSTETFLLIEPTA